MATLTNTKIKDTYKSLLKVSDNGNLEAGLQEITDGEGNASGVQLNTSGNLTASGTIAFGSLKDSGENITITKFVDEADGISGNDNDTTIPTSAAVKNYVDTKVTAEDLDFAGDSGTGAVDLDSQILTIEGTANEVVTSASGQTLTIGLPSTINVDVQGALTGNVTGNVSGNVTGNVTGNVSGDLTGNVTATSVLANGVVATTQASSDNSTKVATTAFVKSVVTAEDLDFGGDSGTGSVDLDSQTLTIAGTANEIVTSAAGQTLTVGLPSSITVDVVGNLTGNVSGNVTGDVTGNADTATALETSRTIALSGDVVASGSFDGSANLTLSATIQPNSVALGTDTTGDYVSNLGAGTGVTIASNTGEGSNPTITVNYGSTANTSVEGDTALTIQGTTNEIEVSGGAVTLGSGGTVTVGLPDNVIIAGDLTVNGTTTTVNTQTLSVKDPLIELANQNLSNSVDTGFFADYSLDAGVTTKYAGLFKDSSDSDKFKLFKGLEVEPATTVDVAGTGYTKGDLVVNDLDAVTISGTLSTAAQTNITSVGTLSSLAVSGNLTVDTNTLFVDAANNRVGIGTSSPNSYYSKDLVVKTTSNEGGITIASNTNTDINYLMFADGTTGDEAYRGFINYQHNGDSMNFATAAITKMTIDSSGNVGIGTASPVSSSNYTFITTNNTTGSGLITQVGTSTSMYVYSTASQSTISEQRALPLVFETSGSERMRIDSSGRVGIGTSSPKNTAHINGSLQIGFVDASNDAMVLSWGGASTNGSIQTFSSSVLALNPAGNNVVIGGTTGTEKLTIVDGNIKMSNGYGIDFSASAGGGATSSLLDDYEEGTWTIGLTFGGASVGMTFTNNTGQYTKVGRQVTVTAYLQTSLIGSSTGAAAITGLPYTIVNDASYYSAPSFWFNQITYDGQLSAYGTTGTTTLEFFDTTQGGTVAALDNTNFQNGSRFIISFTYFTT
jgi:trimeric autotransporter adhesin